LLIHYENIDSIAYDITIHLILNNRTRISNLHYIAQYYESKDLR